MKDNTMKNIDEIIAENNRRKALLDKPYNPIEGIGCCGLCIYGREE